MGTWNTSITGNDTAKDLYIEYSALEHTCGDGELCDITASVKRIAANGLQGFRECNACDVFTTSKGIVFERSTGRNGNRFEGKRNIRAKEIL